jgi:hypothetical protein
MPVNLVIAVTDGDWFDMLQHRAGARPDDDLPLERCRNRKLMLLSPARGEAG